MKSFKLIKILLCSHKEKRARAVEFDPQRTVIIGTNDTGKSSLIKSVYYTFGADSSKVNPNWKDASVDVLLQFSINKEVYSIYRKVDNTISIYDSKDQLLKSYSKITGEYSQYIADLLGFTIKLPNKKGDFIVPPPAFVFIPYYIDQDSGWTTAWNSFKGLQQIKDYKKNTIEYHIGYNSQKLYELQCDRDTKKIYYENEEKEYNILSILKQKIKDTASIKDFAMTFNDFQCEIKRLEQECSDLIVKQKKSKEHLIECYDKKYNVLSQIDITKQTLNELNDDYKFSLSKPNELVCPTCGMNYNNDMQHRFLFIEEENRCSVILQDLEKDLQTINEKIDEERKNINSYKEKYDKISELMHQQKENIALSDIIVNEGTKETMRFFEKDMCERKERLDEVNFEITDLERKIKNEKKLQKERRTKIKEDYKKYMSKYLKQLDVEYDVSSIKDMCSEPKNTGSSSLRTIMAYYFTILHIANNNSSSVFCPIIIDSPNQQAQDISHIKNIYEFILREQPQNTQVILGIEEDYNIDFKAKKIILQDKRHLLQEDEFEKVKEMLVKYDMQLETPSIY